MKKESYSKQEKFYYDFEELHRGDEENIKRRLGFYLPLIKAYKEVSSERPKFLDIGCGRGEFLELISSAGFDVEGVEINSIYVDICKGKGLQVYNTDGLSFLKNIQDEYYHIISLIHVIEHLEVEYLFELMEEVYRVLKPGGVLILETPYAKNPIVGLYYFWIDPTHKRPINADFIRFLGKRIGFDRSEIIVINANLPNLEDVDFKNLFYAVASDISILLFKKSENSFDSKIMSSVKLLKKKSSKDLEEILEILDAKFKNLEQHISILNMNLESIQSNLNMKLESTQVDFNMKLESIQSNLNMKLESIQSNLNMKLESTQVDFNMKLESIQSNLNMKLESIQADFNMIYNSKLWRMYRTLSKLKNSIKGVPRNIALLLYYKLEEKPKLWKLIKKYLDNSPRLKSAIRRFLFKDSFLDNYGEAYTNEEKMDIQEKFFFKKLKKFVSLRD